MVAVFVVDTTGRVEPATVSFVQTGSDYGFRSVVCEHLRGMRLQPATKDGVKRRMLAVMPYVFSVGVPASGTPPEAEAYDRFVTAAPRDAVFADLERRPHC